MNELYWKMLFFLILFIYGFIRGIYSKKYNRKNIIFEAARTQERIMLGFLALGMIILPLLYVTTPLLDSFSINLPDWARWIGVAIAIPSIYLFYLSHKTLDKYWSPVPEIHKDHILITTGPYKYIRHPMYAQAWLWFISQFLILSNWIAGFPGLIIWIIFYFMRVNNEENMLIEQFGNEYREYMNKTGRIIPRLW